MEVQCVVAATGTNGSPDFFPCLITCSQDEYDLGYHYDCAQELAEKNGFESPFIVFEEADGHDWFFEHYTEWHYYTKGTVKSPT